MSKGIIAAALLGGAIGLLMFFTSQPDNRDLGQRIKDSCQEEFGYRGQDAVTQCQLRLLIRKGDEIDQKKMDSAYGRIR